MPEYVMKISPDGETVVGLYSDKLPYRDLGEMQVTRASDVEFDPTIQKWRIWVEDEMRHLPETFITREEAIQHEIDYLNTRVGISIREAVERGGGGR